MISAERFWNLLASQYAASPMDDEIGYRERIDTIKSYLKEDDELLDFGCGTGTVSFDLADSVRSIKGLDISSKMINIAIQRRSETKIQNIDFQQGNLFDQSIDDKEFNAILAMHVLHVIKNTDAILARFHQLLSNDGHLFITVPCIKSMSAVPRIVIAIVDYLHIVPGLRRFSYSEIESALQHNGFSILIAQQDKTHAHTYFIVAKKATAENA